ncbi:Hypothetical predicted protein [Pelobates cultripes]|uniref:Uncharacterized protein n=1 Tax=Pelobates cultripes TaxID=61616 RepID=A0AAD1T7E5_PELCU|nr:Hypothetical predicted protein [Pelobates cultripes]
MSEEASDGTRANSPTFPPEERSPTSEDRDWGWLLQALPTRADLAAANSTFQASIWADIQVLRGDIQGLNYRVGRIEATCDQPRTAHAQGGNYLVQHAEY